MDLIHIRSRSFALHLLLAAAFAISFSGTVRAQSNPPSVVQPGAPGQPTKVLPSSTRPKLPPISRQDVEFMQGMIHHHSQAVEMTALIGERTENKQLRLIGARISQSQQDEMNFMKRWLELRGEPTIMKMAEPTAADHAAHGHDAHQASAAKEHLMPGMLTREQMSALRKASGAEFDRLFLEGMIQHHNGALVMVRDLFDSAGSGQDAELFNFATDVDSGQRAEIKSMQTLLAKIP